MERRRRENRGRRSLRNSSRRLGHSIHIVAEYARPMPLSIDALVEVACYCIDGTLRHRPVGVRQSAVAIARDDILRRSCRVDTAERALSHGTRQRRREAARPQEKPGGRGQEVPRDPSFPIHLTDGSREGRVVRPLLNRLSGCRCFRRRRGTGWPERRELYSTLNEVPERVVLASSAPPSSVLFEHGLDVHQRVPFHPRGRGRRRIEWSNDVRCRAVPLLFVRRRRHPRARTADGGVVDVQDRARRGEPRERRRDEREDEASPVGSGTRVLLEHSFHPLLLVAEERERTLAREGIGR